MYRVRVHDLKFVSCRTWVGLDAETGVPLVIKPVELHRSQEVIRVLHDNRITGIPHVMGLTMTAVGPSVAYRWISGDSLTDKKRDEKEASQLIASMLLLLERVSMVAQREFVHGDLKLQHFIRTGSGQLALTDLTTSYFYPHHQVEKKKKIQGTSAYLAPEIKKGELSATADLYSLALIWLSMLAGKPVYCLNLQQIQTVLGSVDTLQQQCLQNWLNNDPQKRDKELFWKRK